MKCSRFEELPVWKDVIELAVRVYEFTTRPAFKGRYSLKDQIERAAVSVSNNIAEGFERGTTQELLTFLYISRQLRRWADSLQNSDIRGQRYLTSKTKSKTKEAREREEFLKELEQIRTRQQ